MSNVLQNIKFEITESPTGDSAYVDIDLRHYMARVTLWRKDNNTGACDLEIIDTESSVQVKWDHRELADSGDLDDAMSGFFRDLLQLEETKSSTANDPSVSKAFGLTLAGHAVGLGRILDPLLRLPAKAA